MAAIQVQSIQTQPVHFSDFFFGVLLRGEQLHTDRGLHHASTPHGFGQVFLQCLTSGVHVCKNSVVETVEVQLERFALHQMRTFTRHHKPPQSHLRLATGIEPAQFVRGPQIRTQKHWSIRYTDQGTLSSTRQGVEQGCVIAISIGRGFAQQRSFG